MDVNSSHYSVKANSCTKVGEMQNIIDYREHDIRLWTEELEEFVPERVFDAHCHLYDPSCVEDEAGSRKATPVDLGRLRKWAETVYPGRTTNFLLLAKPRPGTNVASHNAMLGREAGADPLSRAHCLATPAYSVAELERDIHRHGFQGLKVYRSFSVTGDIAECRIHEYFPHEQMELANDHRLWVTLHLAKSDGCADEDNLRDLEEYTTRLYPNIRWILAHCARSFTYYPINAAIERLNALPNIWYDLSAVTDVRPFITLFTRGRLDRMFYGSDGVDAVSFHGKYVTLGHAWQMLYADEVDIQFPHCTGRPVLALYEQLLAIKHAAEIAGLSNDDIENLFTRNAYQAFGIQPE